MKFLISKKLSKKSPIFAPLIGMLLLFFISIFFNLAYINSKISLIPNEAVQNILGNEEAFIEPILFEELLAIAHTEFLYYMFFIVLLFFTYYRLSQNKRSTKELISCFVLIQIALVSLSFSQMFGKTLIYLFLISFPLANLMLLYVLIRVTIKLVRNG